MKKAALLLALVVVGSTLLVLGDTSSQPLGPGVVEEPVERVLTSDTGMQIVVAGLRIVSERSIPFFVEYVIADTGDSITFV